MKKKERGKEKARMRDKCRIFLRLPGTKESIYADDVYTVVPNSLAVMPTDK